MLKKICGRKKAKMEIDKAALSDVLLWVMSVAICSIIYFISGDGMRCIMFAILLIWGADRFIDWIGEGK